MNEWWTSLGVGCDESLSGNVRSLGMNSDDLGSEL